MIRNTLSLLCLTGAIAGTALADEYSVIEKPFKKVTTLDGTFLPKESTAVSIAPKVWKDFTVTSFVDQGTTVKKGDILIGIDTTKADEQIAKAEEAREIELLKLAKAKHELAQLEIATPRKLENFARTEKEDADNLKWFTEIGMPIDIKSSLFRVKRSEQSLAYQMEELKQLEKMYSEDNKTEETEEIILTRTRNNLEQVKFSLNSTKIRSARTLDTEIPRQLEDYQRTAENSRLANTAAKENLTRALEIKRLEVAQAEKTDAEKVEKLAELKADRAMMNITAPADGLVYYGSIKNGQWNPAAALKVIKIGGKLPAHLTLLTFIPTKSELLLSAFAPEDQLSSLKKGASGHANTQMHRYKSFPVTINGLNKYPEANGKYKVKITLNEQQDQQIVPGMKATVRIFSNQLDNAIVVPTNYLTVAEDGSHTVKIKLADGETADRPVEISASNKTQSVITKGLEVDQVIVK